MVVGVHLDAGPERPVREHHVELLPRELAEEVLDHPVLAADELDGLADVERGLEELLHQHLGQHVRDADGQAQRRAEGRPFSVPTRSWPSEKISSA